jgi:hypothetical protein
MAAIIGYGCFAGTKYNREEAVAKWRILPVTSISKHMVYYITNAYGSERVQSCSNSELVFFRETHEQASAHLKHIHTTLADRMARYSAAKSEAEGAARALYDGVRAEQFIEPVMQKKPKKKPALGSLSDEDLEAELAKRKGAQQ